MREETVLVTGGTGYIAAFCIAALLRENYAVRTTIRSLDRADEAREHISRAGADLASADLTFVEANLLSDDGWAAAMADCIYVLHVASPLTLEPPKDPDLVIRPAVEGTLRVLRFARDAGVRRVVMTSSSSAITNLAVMPGRMMDEHDWSDPTIPDTSPYVQSKTLAERAAWDFIRREGEGMELATILPVGVVGPVVGAQLNGTSELVRQIIEGKLAGMPNIEIGLVDVRDVADLHLLAMTSPKALGERFAASTGRAVSVKELDEVLLSVPGAAIRKPLPIVPNWVMRVLALVQPQCSEVVQYLKRPLSVSNEKATTLLGWNPRSPHDALYQAGESIVAHTRRVKAEASKVHTVGQAGS